MTNLCIIIEMCNFCSISPNGKRIAEVREKGSRNFQLYPNVSKMFFRELNYEKPVKRKTFCG